MTDTPTLAQQQAQLVKDLAATERLRRRETRNRAKRQPPVYYCPHCGSVVCYKGFYECEGGCGSLTQSQLVPAALRSAPVTCTDTPPLVDCGENTTTKEDAMPSHASKAADRAEENRKQRETSSGATLQLVPEPDPPKSGATKGDEARAAIVAELPEYQQAEYARLRTGGTRHVTALAQAKRLPDPATPTDDVAKAAADLFAAFTAGQVGSAAPPVTVAAATGKPGPLAAHGDPDLPAASAAAADRRADLPKPAAAAPQPKVEAKPKPVPPPAPVDGSCYRHIGVISAETLNGPESHDCPHAATNGHMTVEAAAKCAAKLLGHHPNGTISTRHHPVRRDLSGRRLS